LTVISYITSLSLNCLCPQYPAVRVTWNFDTIEEHFYFYVFPFGTVVFLVVFNFCGCDSYCRINTKLNTHCTIFIWNTRTNFKGDFWI